MKKWLLIGLVVLCGLSSWAEVTVSNLVVAQRAGTKLVDISYDLACDTTNAVSVSLSVSNGTAAVSAPSVTGDVGAGVAIGIGKSIVWDGGADADGLLLENVTVSVFETPPLYLVVDLSGGTAASSYPVSSLDAVPLGGWTDEHKTTKLVLRQIPAGTFMMGSPSGELGRDSDETQHQVTLTQDFYIGVFEVTQRQWELVMGDKPSYFNNTSYYQTRPVEQVSYNDIRGTSAGADWPGSGNVDATSFIGKLRAKTGLTLDLPTESQWEYACRAGTMTALNSGKNLTSTGSDPNMSEVGRYWYNGGSGYSSIGNTSVGTAAAGAYLPNAWGLYDMHGNVSEWCLDWYGTYPGTVSDPVGATSGSHRMDRGGGWHSGAEYCRSARRDNGDPSLRHYSFGLRVGSAPPVQ